MGVSGSGKSTIAPLLAERREVPFLDADTLHPRANILKMARGVALDDADRLPWLELVADALAAARPTGGLVVACSALKVAYRDTLRRGATDIFFAHLAPPTSALRSRTEHRVGHFMPATLLPSQLATVESLRSHEWGLQIEAIDTPSAIVDLIIRSLA